MLVTGATGFIGSRVAEVLERRGHVVIRAVREPRRAESEGARRDVRVDFSRDFDAGVWRPRLAGVDAVVNAVGILRQTRRQSFEAIHVRAPRALFVACAEAGVRRVVQISALGADEHARSGYHRSKKAADDLLLSLPVSGVVAQPSLVFGPGGTSAALFSLLASLPVIAVPGRGEQTVQPIHVDDLAEAVAALVESGAGVGQRLPLVGPEPLSLRQMLAELRGALGFGRAPVLPVPMPLVRLAARAGRWLPGALLDPETLAMLERGNTADAAVTRDLLGRPPRPVTEFLTAAQAREQRREAQLAWLLPLLRVSVALVWIVTGIVSLGVYPAARSHELLARVGVSGAFASLLLDGAAALDLALGVATLLLQRRHWLWLVQIALILGYTLLITLRLPEFWLHPYGPVLKNLPMLAAIVVLQQLESRPRWR